MNLILLSPLPINFSINAIKNICNEIFNIQTLFTSTYYRAVLKRTTKHPKNPSNFKIFHFHSFENSMEFKYFQMTCEYVSQILEFLTGNVCAIKAEIFSCISVTRFRIAVRGYQGYINIKFYTRLLLHKQEFEFIASNTCCSI